MKKKSLYFLLLLLAFGQVYGQQDRKIDNAAAFTKLYGYVRYFHPSDEASEIDWDRFAIYGSKHVEGCKSPEELKATLTALFQPIAPTVQVYLENEEVKFNTAATTPPSLKKYKTIAWQHQGMGQGGKNSPYISLRTNRPVLVKTSSAQFGPIMKAVPASEFQGKEFMFTGKVKRATGSGTGHLWVRVDKTNNSTGFFDNMGGRSIQSDQWTTYEIKGKVDKGADKIVVGAFLMGEGELWLDDMSLKVNDNGTWKEIYNEQFTGEKEGLADKILSSGLSWKPGNGYLFMIRQNSKDDKWLSIKSEEASVLVKKKTSQIFKSHPKLGEHIAKTLAGGVKAIVPLALYGTEAQTYPAADRTLLTKLRKELEAIPASDINGANLYTRLGNTAITWNVFQHFYPYFDIAKTDWHRDLRQALASAYTDQTATDFQKTLQLLTAKLKDGHVWVTTPENKATHLPPIAWEWVEDKLAITAVYDEAIPLTRGDIVTSIDGTAPETYFKNLHQYISAATPGWLNHRAKSESLLGEHESTLKLAVLKADNSTTDLELKRNFSYNQVRTAIPSTENIRSVAAGVTYVNIGKASMKDIKAAMPTLQQSKAIICDLRGYPNSNHDLINYLLPARDTSSQWMQTPHIIYPDQEKIVGYRKSSWGLRPKSPRLTAKVIFLIDGQAISYAESYMSFIEHYKLATIVGQPTAGTNGNINPFMLPGGYRISWTGMKVLKHDGSQLHGVGILPDVYVEKTIQGIREGRDEFLEKAILLAGEAL
ncbi:peptidase S41 [Pontibacter sp. JH31]|uniref:Peptidase S41 n=1 Tax=Pontibacter aquaedesilientis TaxID=2766980 RepID=A0ABR7XI51_9BACT|nr:S41 family peptidase [Pontibacter aquaedesilientis]MBD1397318.1 peptidase S41 [Pontibacter aquaedesilientis]